MQCPMCGSEKVTNYFREYYECGDCGYCDIAAEFEEGFQNKHIDKKPHWDDEDE